MKATTRTTYCGWWQTRDRWGQPTGYEAYRRDEHADWFDLYSANTWWQALAIALDLAATVPGCQFEGGPMTWTPDLDGRAKPWPS